MAVNYPSSLDSWSNPAGTQTQDGPVGDDHATQHTNHNGAIIALEKKLGIGAGSAAVNQLLFGQGAGSATWGSVGTNITLVTSTFNNGTFGTPTLQSPTINGLGTNSGTIATGVYNNATLGTPAITGGTATNITLVSPTGSIVSVRDKNFTTGSIGSSVALGTLYSYTVPANQLGTNGYITIESWGQILAGTTTTLDLVLAYNTGTFSNTTRTFVASPGTISWYMTVFLANNGTTNAQKGGFFFSGQETTNGGNYVLTGYGTTGVDSTAAGTITVAAQLGTALANVWITLQVAKTTLS